MIARHGEKVVNKFGCVLRVALDDLQRARAVGFAEVVAAEQMRPTENRRHRPRGRNSCDIVARIDPSLRLAASASSSSSVRSASARFLCDQMLSHFILAAAGRAGRRGARDQGDDARRAFDERDVSGLGESFEHTQIRRNFSASGGQQDEREVRPRRLPFKRFNRRIKAVAVKASSVMKAAPAPSDSFRQSPDVAARLDGGDARFARSRPVN